MKELTTPVQEKGKLSYKTTVFYESFAKQTLRSSSINFLWCRR